MDKKIMLEIENQILELFDTCPTRQQMVGLAKMYGISMEKLKSILTKNGREIPAGSRGPKPKAKGLKADIVILDEAAVPISSENVEVAKADPEVITKMPDCVVKTIEKRMHELEGDIKNYQEAINNYQDMIQRLENEYTAHYNYLMSCPFEQGNLSHSCSDNMIESPQPVG